MDKDYTSIDIDILKEFIDGEINDIYLFVKKYCYKDMYRTIYEYCFNKLTQNDNLEKFIAVALSTYKLQNKLNKALKVTDGKYFDNYLMRCVCSEFFRKFERSDTFKNETKESFRSKVVKAQETLLDNQLISEYNVNFLTSLIRNKFSNKENSSIEEIIEFIKELSTGETEKKCETTNFLTYFNQLITNNKLSLNQLGAESLIKKEIYEISLGKKPTKNQLIMLVFALKLNKNETETLFNLAKELVKTSYDSNIYSFEAENERDILILHWINNIDQLELIAEKEKKKIVEIVNNILKESNFDILK